MPAYSQEQVPVEFEADVAQTRTIGQGGMTIAFERLSAGVETAPPGHNVVVEEDALVVEFSPTDERARTMEHAAQVMQAAGA